MPSAGRSSGVLLHPTSLPGPFGLGDLGPDAHRFVDALRRMEQSWWQMLPIGPTGYGDSPYQPSSTFAGNPLLVSPETLAAGGLIDPVRDPPDFPPREAEYGRVIRWRMARLAEAAARFDQHAAPDLADGLEAFVEHNGEWWLDDFALFTALKRANGGRPWWDWERGLARRHARALAAARRRLDAQVRAVMIEQYLFERQFQELRAESRERGVGLIGDIPIFVAHDSADVWANPELFHLDRTGRPTAVAGVPPDYFSETGQRWGNPLYRWERHRRDGYEWWARRMRRLLSMFDLVRIDHFRGFVACWQIPAGDETAVGGRWVPGPADDLFDALQARLGPLPLIAEDLGVITPDVEELRDRLGLPGMRVLQFGLADDGEHSPDRFPENVVAYTGTHDNDTAVGWWRDPANARERRRAGKVLGGGSEPNLRMIEAVMASRARIAIFPLQDLLGLGSEARMNVPGAPLGNWRWRFAWEDLTDAVVARMRTLTLEHGRA